MMSKKMIKIICIVMAALMVLSVFAVCLQVFALDTGVMNYVPAIFVPIILVPIMNMLG